MGGINMDTNKLTDLTDSLKHYKNEIRIKTEELNSPYEYVKYSQSIPDLDFSIYGLTINLDNVKDIEKRLKIAEKTHSDCYVRIEEQLGDMWDEWSSGDCLWFNFYGDLKFTEEEIEDKKSVLRNEIEKYELKCKEVERELRELIVNG
jgi:hypothetical protein